jgi:hypothetical protein
MVRRWDLAMVEREMACASLCVGSMRDYRFMRDCPPSWPPLLALIWGARSWGPVQVGYRCLLTLTSLGLLGLRVSILFLGCSR